MTASESVTVHTIVIGAKLGYILADRPVYGLWGLENMNMSPGLPRVTCVGTFQVSPSTQLRELQCSGFEIVFEKTKVTAGR